MSIKNDIKKIKQYKLTYKNKRDFLRKINKSIIHRLMNIYVSIQFNLHNKSLNQEQRERILNWKWYIYLKRKYRKYLNKLNKYEMPTEIIHPQIIWWSWLQGEENAPELCRACLKSLRKNMPNYEIKIVTESNMWDFITVPDFIRKKYEKGTIPRTHFSDLLRTCLLVEHGGIWMDSTVLCTGNLSPSMFNNNLFFYQNFKRGEESMCFSSWLISACKNEPTLLLTRDLLFYYWSRNNKLCHYFIYHFFFNMVCEKYPELLKAVPRFSNLPPHILQFEMFEKYDSLRWQQIITMSPFHKLTWKYDIEKDDIKDSYYKYILSEFGE